LVLLLGWFVDEATLGAWFGETAQTAPGSGVVFIARYIDDNNMDAAQPQRIAYLDTKIIERHLEQ
jgi:hypothetical protein